MRESFPRTTSIESRASREVYAERLRALLEQRSQRINESAGVVRGTEKHLPIVDAACRIRPDSFVRSKNGGPYEKEQALTSVRYDDMRVLESELKHWGVLDRDGVVDEAWARARGVEEEVREYAAWCVAHNCAEFDALERALLHESDDTDPRASELWQHRRERAALQSRLFGAKLAEWKRGAESSPPAMAEVVVLAMLQKALGSAYTVVRSAPLDDYLAGVDTVVLDRVTGEVMCTFDELYDDRPQSDERYEKKWRTNRARIRKGEGFAVKYGFTYETTDGQQELVRTPLVGIPAFPLRLHQQDLSGLLEGGEVFSDERSDREHTILRTMLAEARDYATREADHLGQNTHAQARIAHINTLIRAVEEGATGASPNH